MQLFRTLCVVAVLGALTYGAYVTLTSSPPVPPPTDVVNITSPPHIELPSGGGTLGPPKPLTPSTGVSSAPTAPRFSAAPQLEPAPAATGAAGEAKPGGGGATITGIRPQASVGGPPPSIYPNTNVPPGPFDGAGAGTPIAGAPTNNASLPGTSISGMSAGGNTAVAPPLTPITPVSASAPSAGPSGATMIPAVPGAIAPPVTPTPSAAGPFAAVQPLLQQGQFAAALNKLSESFDNESLSDDDARRVNELLDQLAGTVIYSRDHLLLPPHTVQPGERLDQIAARYGASWELLAKINGLPDPWNLPPGTQLKVVPGPFGALIDKSQRRLTLFVGQMYAGSFTIGFGRDRPPADGTYTVAGKLPNPAYNGPDLQLAADDPNNPLGERLIDLGVGGQVIHGTSEPANLASDDARGCIRLSARDIEDVYDILMPGSQVIIRP